MTEHLNLDWKAPGPIAARFMASTAMVQIINGPVGSGKTTAALMKSIRIAARQRPSLKHRLLNSNKELVPVRRFKLAVIRDTYRQLWKTTLPSWHRRVPKEAGEWNGAENAPASHRINLEVGTGTINSTMVDFTAEFGAIGENAVEDFMRGYEPTAFYLNELDLLAQQVLAYAQDRAGRFPEMDDGGPSWRGVLADCNAPEFENWLYMDSESDPATGQPRPGVFTMTPAERAALGVDLFIQPGGREPGAENMENLPAGYYMPKVGQSASYVARMIDNKSGYSQAGKPVHPEFRSPVHVAARELEPLPGVPLIIGLDPRTNPSAEFMQRLVNGQRRFVDEMQLEQNTGPRRFGEKLAQVLRDRFSFLKPEMIRGVCDPSARNGVDREAGDQDWMEIVSAVTGIRIDAAPTNNIDMRREALKVPLGKLIDGEPAILISSRCRLLCAGLASGFRFRKLNVPGSLKYSDEVEKNNYADACEAAEYACLMDGADLEIRERKEADVQRLHRMQQQSQTDWDPFKQGNN